MIIRDLDLLRIYPNNIEHCVFRIFDFMEPRCWFEFSNILIEANVSFPLKNIGKSSSISYDRIWMIKEPVGCLGFLPPSAVIYYHGQFGKLFITDIGYECLTRYMKDWYLRLVTNSSLLHINILKSTLLTQHSTLQDSIYSAKQWEPPSQEIIVMLVILTAVEMLWQLWQWDLTITAFTCRMRGEWGVRTDLRHILTLTDPRSAPTLELARSSARPSWSSECSTAKCLKVRSQYWTSPVAGC